MNDVLMVNNLTKQFGSFMAVDHISFSVGEGEIVGLLGPNGAGKTTTISMILGVLSKTSGQMTIFGRDYPKYRQDVIGRDCHEVFGSGFCGANDSTKRESMR